MNIKEIADKQELTESKIDWNKETKKEYSKSKDLYDKLRDS